jgi:WD40 repeat protein
MSHGYTTHRALPLSFALTITLLLAGCGSGGAARVQATHTATLPSVTSPVLAYSGHGAHVISAAWSPDGTRVVSGGDDTTLQVWDAKSGKKLWGYTFPTVGGFNGVFAVAWSADGKRIAGGDFAGKVIVFDAAAGTPQLTLTNLADSFVSGVAFSPDGARIAAGTGTNGIHIWNVATGKLLLTYTKHTRPVFRIAWSPDGTRIASASDDGSVQVWDPTTGTTALTYTDHHAPVWAVAWSPDGKRIASGTGEAGAQGPNYVNNGARVWDATTGQTLVTFTAHGKNQVYALAWSPDGSQIVSSGDDGTSYVWDAATGNITLMYHATFFWSDDWSPKTNLIASASNDGTVQLWRPALGS